MIACQACGEDFHETAPICPHCGAVQKPRVRSNEGDDLPDGIGGWSWGAFLLSWVWAIGNRTWIGLLALVPLVGLIMLPILGMKGREWAWKNNDWEDVEHFNRVQRKWSIWAIAIICSLAALAVASIPAYRDYAQHRTQSVQVLQLRKTLSAPASESIRIWSDSIKKQYIFIMKEWFEELASDLDEQSFECGELELWQSDDKSATLASVQCAAPRFPSATLIAWQPSKDAPLKKNVLHDDRKPDLRAFDEGSMPVAIAEITQHSVGLDLVAEIRSREGHTFSRTLRWQLSNDMLISFDWAKRKQ